MRISPEGMEDIDLQRISPKRTVSYIDAVDKVDDAEDLSTSSNRLVYAEKPGVLSHQYSKRVSKNSIDISWSNINYDVTFKEGFVPFKRKTVHKQVLQNNSGYAKAGQLFAIVGPASSGKSSLLNVLAGRIRNFSGTIAQNGKKLPRHWSEQVGYVLQQDLLYAVLTVQETLMYAARFKLPSSYSEEDRTSIVEDMIDELGLRVCAGTKIGNAFIRGVSGGQRKRVSIGIELVSRSNVVFLDVPTGGLDSTAALALVLQLKQLAEKSRTVIISVDQPNLKMFNLFDNMQILSEGCVIYTGPASNAVDFFASQDLVCPVSMNPPDYFLTKVNVDFPGSVDVAKLSAAFHSSTYAQELEGAIKAIGSGGSLKAHEQGSQFQTSFFTQFKLLLSLNLIDSIRNPTLYWMRVAMFAMLSIVVGTLYFDVGTSNVDNRTSVIFFFCSFMPFMTIAAVPAFIDSRDIFVRERASGSYRVSAYVLANLLSSIPWLLLITILVSCIGYWMVKLNPDSYRFGYFMLIVFLELNVSESLIVAVSAISPFALLGIAIGAGIFGTMMLLCGFFLIPGNIRDWWIWAHYSISFHTYSFNGLMANDYATLTFQNVLDPNTNELVTMSGKDYLERIFSINLDLLAVDVVVLIAMGIFYRIVLFVILYFKHDGKR